MKKRNIENIRNTKEKNIYIYIYIYIKKRTEKWLSKAQTK